MNIFQEIKQRWLEFGAYCLAPIGLFEMLYSFLEKFWTKGYEKIQNSPLMLDYSGYVFIIIILISVVVAGWRIWVTRVVPLPHLKEVLLTIKGKPVRVSFGDLFQLDKKYYKTIPIGQYPFETNVKGVLQKSLIKLFKNDDTTPDSSSWKQIYYQKIQNAIQTQGISYEDTEHPSKIEDRYLKIKISEGTIFNINRDGGEKYLLLALTPTEQQGHDVKDQYTTHHLQNVLDIFWKYVGRITNYENIAIPLLGHNANVYRLTPQETLFVNLWAIKTVLDSSQTQIVNATFEINIVIYQGDEVANKIDLRKFKDFWENLGVN